METETHYEWGESYTDLVLTITYERDQTDKEYEAAKRKAARAKATKAQRAKIAAQELYEKKLLS